MSEPLVLVEKDGKKLRVHPSTVESHQRAGWHVAQSEPEAAAEGAEGGKKGKKSKEQSAEGNPAEESPS
jgi:hypothetical protein